MQSVLYQREFSQDSSNRSRTFHKPSYLTPACPVCGQQVTIFFSINPRQSSHVRCWGGFRSAFRQRRPGSNRAMCTLESTTYHLLPKLWLAYLGGNQLGQGCKHLMRQHRSKTKVLFQQQFWGHLPGLLLLCLVLIRPPFCPSYNVTHHFNIVHCGLS